MASCRAPASLEQSAARHGQPRGSRVPREVMKKAEDGGRGQGRAALLSTLRRRTCGARLRACDGLGVWQTMMGQKAKQRARGHPASDPYAIHIHFPSSLKLFFPFAFVTSGWSFAGFPHFRSVYSPLSRAD